MVNVGTYTMDPSWAWNPLQKEIRLKTAMRDSKKDSVRVKNVNVEKEHNQNDKDGNFQHRSLVDI